MSEFLKIIWQDLHKDVIAAGYPATAYPLPYPPSNSCPVSNPTSRLIDDTPDTGYPYPDPANYPLNQGENMNKYINWIV